jgi:ferric-dicitrate binding protein FerR (iron transport regulator)
LTGEGRHLELELALLGSFAFLQRIVRAVTAAAAACHYVQAMNRKLAFAAAFALCAGSAASASIGSAELVRIWASGRPLGAPERALYQHDDVFAQEALRTVDGGALHVVFDDGTELRMGSAATVTLDEFVYDGEAGAGKLVGSVARGIARFITGKVDKDAFVIRTAAAAIGVRGTDFSVWVEASGRTTIWVNSGAITVTPVGGAPAEVGEGETVAVAAGGGEVQRDALRPPGDPGLLNPLLIGR